MSYLWNPLVTAQQLEERNSENGLPSELQDSIRYYTARLTQAAGILLQLPQAIVAQALVTLYRFWTVENLMSYEFSDVSAASLYLTAKISFSPRSMRSITNIYTYLLSSHSALRSPSNIDPSAAPPSDLDSLYVTELAYFTFRTRVLNIEGQICNALGFETHVALPHPLAVTYLQALDIFGSSQRKGMGSALSKRTIEYLNTALLSPQMLYLTHQPTTLATAAIYLAARDCGAKLPGCEWWEVFDTDREELGFLALGMKSLEGWVKREGEVWGERGWLTRTDVGGELKRRGDVGMAGGDDEEAEMMRLMDERISQS